MNDRLREIVNATRASHSAMSAMARHAREARNAARVLERNSRMVASGAIKPEIAAIGNRIAEQRKAKSAAAYARAERRFRRAQDLLAALPL